MFCIYRLCAWSLQQNWPKEHSAKQGSAGLGSHSMILLNNKSYDYTSCSSCSEQWCSIFGPQLWKTPKPMKNTSINSKIDENPHPCREIICFPTMQCTQKIWGEPTFHSVLLVFPIVPDSEQSPPYSQLCWPNTFRIVSLLYRGWPM